MAEIQRWAYLIATLHFLKTPLGQAVDGRVNVLHGGDRWWLSNIQSLDTLSKAGFELLAADGGFLFFRRLAQSEVAEAPEPPPPPPSL